MQKHNALDLTHLFGRVEFLADLVSEFDLFDDHIFYVGTLHRRQFFLRPVFRFFRQQSPREFFRQRRDVPFERLIRVAEMRHRFFRNVVDHVVDVIVKIRSVENESALFVYELALSVYYVVVFERSLSARKVVAFNSLLRVFDCVGKYICLDRLIFGNVESVGDHRKSFAREQTEKIVFKRNVEAAFTDVALTSRASAQLIVDTS